MILSSRSTSSATTSLLMLVCGIESARAESVEETDLWFGSVMLTSDYVDRGVSQSDSHAAVQGNVGWRHASGIYAAVWASSVDFDDGGEATVEVNYTAGLEREYQRFAFSADVTYVDFPGAASSLKYDLLELAAAVETDLAGYGLSVGAIFSPEQAGDAGRALYAFAGLSRPVSENAAWFAHVGRQRFEDETVAGPDYNDWGAGFEWQRGALRVTLAYTDTDARSACADTCDARLVASVSIEIE